MDKNLHEQASDILAKVIDLPKEEALQLITEQCKGNTLLEQEVLSLYQEFTVIPHQKKENKKSQPRVVVPVKSLLEKTEILTRVSNFALSKKSGRLLLIITVLIALSILGVFIRKGVYNSIFSNVLEDRTALLNANATILYDWINNEKEKIDLYASSKAIREVALRLDSIGHLNIPEKQKDKLLLPLSVRLKEIARVLKVEDFGIIDKNTPKIILNTFSSTDSSLSFINKTQLTKEFYDYHLRLKKGETIFFKPIHNENILYNGESIYQYSDCGVVAPIYDNNGEIISFLYYATWAQNEFSNLFKPSQYGSSSQLYAIDEKGRMISESRFTKEISQVLSLDTLETITSIYYVYVQNPGVNLMQGEVPKDNKNNWNFTAPLLAISDYLENKSQPSTGQIDYVYKDYRGVEVIGAYMWLDDLEIGLISEIDEKDAMEFLSKIDLLFGVLYAIIIILLFLLYHSNITIIKYNKKIIELGKLGQYHIIDKIGEGGFGEVYKAEHQLLKMPVAIKVLKKELATEEAIQRFEKEVKITSSLKHPNTIKVYDFGTSPEGNFYYVMEFIDGITLTKALEIHQPFPISRLIYVLKEVCYSLREAHQHHLVHRDIKPMNILLTQQGGAVDQVKLLDFGLVKDLEKEEQTQLHKIGGTPMYMAPERLRDPYNNDTRVDIYSLGALGLYMLSGKFLVELISQKVMSGEDTIQGNFRDKLIDRTDVPEQLKELLLSCIRFDPEKRIQSVEEMIDILEELAINYPWHKEEAEKWWKKYDVY
ncbi:serine/threonine-protein kinase [Flammeovirga sp. SubArs3]|uniref:serine/threonine protein kinase n=1 Tax=Flammeovirga sp. SubArs3 TaxID=2995316 RepID=UPI00248D157D|nr:serine/threonine-protein kinase [Flammeovirga sp. SubArs3]